jgi:TrmH RNA methyltransferase
MKQRRPFRDGRPPGRIVRPHAGRSHTEGDEPASQQTRPRDKLVRIAGLPSVTEVFRSAGDRVERLYFDADSKGHVQAWCGLLARRRKVYRQVDPDEMLRVAGTAMHGGVVALVHPRPIRDLDLVEAAAWAAAGKGLLVLDGVGNPQNIGAIARTAGFFGVEHMAFTSHTGQAGLSDVSYRVANGALEHISIHRIADTTETLRRLGGYYHVVGTAIGKGKSMKEIDKARRPIALVLGSEETGLAPATLAACGSVVSLAGSAKVPTLNISAAAAILVHGLLARGT